MQAKKLVIISDLHIGAKNELDDFKCEKELILLLDKLESDKDTSELLILGDFFDLWKIKPENENQIEKIIENRKELFNRLKKFGSKFKITVIPGNHDHGLYYRKEYGESLKEYNINVVPQQYFKREFKQNGKNI